MTIQPLHGVMIGEKLTTMDVPHKRFDHSGKRYYVATYPEGDLVIHEWSPTDNQGYGGSQITFLMEDGSFETVRGPYHGGDIFDFGREEIAARHGITGKPSAFRISIVSRKDFWNCEIYWQEPALSCEPMKPRLEAAVATGIPEGHVVRIDYRNSSYYMTPYRLSDGTMCDPLKEVLA